MANWITPLVFIAGIATGVALSVIFVIFSQLRQMQKKHEKFSAKVEAEIARGARPVDRYGRSPSGRILSSNQRQRPG